MLLKNLLAALDPPPLAVLGNSDCKIGSVVTHASQVGKGALFVAIAGTRADGHSFVSEAVKNGANAVVVEKYFQSLSLPQVVVQSSRRALAQMSAAYFDFPLSHIPVIGVTGTNGKTSVTYLCEAIAKAAGFNPAVLGTIESRCNGWHLPSRMTVPPPPLLYEILREIERRGATHLFAEVTSHALHQERFCGVNMSVAAFTNLTQDHLDYHPDLEAYFACKALLFSDYLNRAKNPVAVINVDDPWGKRLVSGIDPRVKVLTYSVEGCATLRVEQMKLSLQGLQAQIVTSQGPLFLSSPLIGRHNLSNLLCAVGIAEGLGLSREAIIEGAKSLSSIPGRLQPVTVGQEYCVFVDYAHTDDALRRTGETLKALSPHSKLITVFGCGGDRDPHKRPLMAKAVAEFSSYAVVTSDNPRSEDPLKIIDAIVAGFPPHFQRGSRFEVVVDRREAIGRALRHAKKGDIVLIAGKGHETYQIIGDQVLPFDDGEVARLLLQETQTEGSAG